MIEQSSVGNLLLRRLAAEEFAALGPNLERVALKAHQVVALANEPVHYAWFPENGLGSVILPTGDSRLEVGVFGREAVVGSALVLGTGRTPLETFIQIPGVWLRIRDDHLCAATREYPRVHALLLRYVQVLLVTVASTALSNGAYKLQERLARWLLMTHDRVDGDDLPLTHAFLSLMLGVRRSGVTTAIHALEGAALIRARRGVITVLRRTALEQAAGGSYGQAEAEYERLLGPFPPKRHPGTAWQEEGKPAVRP